MNNNNKMKYLARNTILFTISSFGSKLLVFFLVPLYTSVLSTGEYGLADLVTTSSNLIVYIFSLNIADSVIRFAIDRKEKQHEVLSYGIKVVLKGGTLLSAIILIVKMLDLISWPSYCYIFILLNYFFFSLNHIFSNYLKAIDRISDAAIAGIITTCGVILSNIVLLLYFRIGIIGYMLSLIIGDFLSITYSLARLKLPIKMLIQSNCTNELKVEMKRYSIPLIFNGIAWWMNSSLDRYFVTAICGVSANGIYAVASKIPTILSTVNTIFSQAWNISAIKEFDKDDSDGFFSNTYTAYNLLLVLSCSGLILFNVPLARVLFAKEFFVAWRYSSILLISILFSATSGFIGSIFSAVKNSKVFAISTIAGAILNTVLNILLIPIYEATGAAIATCISFIVIWGVRLICSRKYINLRNNWGKDLFAYLLLVLQVIVEHTYRYGFFQQVVILIVIVLIYHNEIISIYNTRIKNVRKKTQINSQ